VNYPFFKDSLRLRRIKKKLKKFPKPASGAVYEFDKAEESVENAHSHILLGHFKKLMPSVDKTEETKTLYQFDGQGQKDFRSWIRYNEFYAHMQRVLIKVDRMSMAHSLEVRVPLLDQRIVDFAWHLDSDFGLTKKEELKKFLKRALSQHIPLDMMNQKKMGFYVPIGDWLKTTLKDDVQDLLLNKPIYGEEYLDRSVWNALVTAYYEGKGGISEWGIWIMYSWQKWGLKMKQLL
jgi:asparagine synthase (glutamine-hydrolysing)